MDAKLFQLLTKSLKQASALSKGKGRAGNAFPITGTSSAQAVKISAIKEPRIAREHVPASLAPAKPRKTRIVAIPEKARNDVREHVIPSGLQPIDARIVREMTGLSQSDFASLMNVSVKTLQNWEQHRREPTGPAASLLKIVSKAPKVALDALHT